VSRGWPQLGRSAIRCSLFISYRQRSEVIVLFRCIDMHDNTHQWGSVHYWKRARERERERERDKDNSVIVRYTMVRYAPHQTAEAVCRNAHVKYRDVDIPQHFVTPLVTPQLKTPKFGSNRGWVDVLSRKTAIFLKRGKMAARLLSMTNRKLHTHLIGTQINDLEWHWTTTTHFVWNGMRFRSPSRKFEWR